MATSMGITMAMVMGMVQNPDNSVGVAYKTNLIRKLCSNN